MEGRDLGDSQILGSTVQENKDGKVRFKTTLPSGRDLVSEYMNPDDANGKIVIKWCEHVRAQIDVDNAEEAAAKKREMVAPIASAEPTGTTSNEDSLLAEDLVSGEPDPVAFAIEQRDAYEERVHILEERLTQMKVERKTMRQHYEQWQKVVETLRGETDEY